MSGPEPLVWSSGFGNDFEALGVYFDLRGSGPFVGQHAFMGVEFERQGNTHYGWVLLQVSEFGAFCSIDAWAWETRPSVPIVAGAVPEPSSRVLAGFGLLALLIQRHRKSLRSQKFAGSGVLTAQATFHHHHRHPQ